MAPKALVFPSMMTLSILVWPTSRGRWTPVLLHRKGGLLGRGTLLHPAVPRDKNLKNLIIGIVIRINVNDESPNTPCRHAADDRRQSEICLSLMPLLGCFKFRPLSRLRTFLKGTVHDGNIVAVKIRSQFLDRAIQPRRSIRLDRRRSCRGLCMSRLL